MLPRKRWKILNEDANRSIIDIILNNRNLPANHLDGFRLSERTHSPYLLPDMDKAVERILQALQRKEKIVIFGDYDVDGVTSTALMLYFFKHLNYPVEYILPSREKDGYGLRPEAVERIAAMKCNLIITVDNGITSNEAVDYAAKLNIDVVITDHHLQEGDLPKACAVVNPNRSDSEYPFKTICGAVVAYKIIYALAEKLLPEEEYKQFLLRHLDLVAMGTIADVMPLRDENYALVKFGLKVLSATRKPGLVELKRMSGVKGKNVTPISVGYFLSPRLNAAGRLGAADDALKLLMADSLDEASPLANYLDKINLERQKLQNNYLKDALEQLGNNNGKMDKVIFIENDDWQAGLIGLISGQLKERFYRPALAFTRDAQGNLVGSVRSIDSFHITKALSRFNHYFINYGGHSKAAGLTLAEENYQNFKNEFTAYANKMILAENLIPELEIDSVVDIEQITMNNARLIQEIGPFGETNEEPIFLLRAARIRDIFMMGNDKHLKIKVEKGNQTFECVWWRGIDYKDELGFGEKIDLAFRLGINNWQGRERLQLIVEDAAKVS